MARRVNVGAVREPPSGPAQNDVLTGYRAVEDFDASETGVSFGRYYKSSTGNYTFVAMVQNMPGSANSYPRVGPALITACIVFGSGSLLISANIGATHGYQLLWLLVLTGILMGTYIMTPARMGVAGGATPCTLILNILGGLGLLVVVLMAVRVLMRLVLTLT